MNQDSPYSAPAPGSTSLESKWWLSLPRKWWILITVGTGTFMAALDGSIVNTVLPVIRQSFGADLSTIEWVVIAYLLTLSILLLSFGRLGDIVGHKRIYNSGFIVFTAGSVLCGLSPTEWLLVASRIFQALGAAMLSSTSPAILTGSFPARQRGQVLGMQGTMTYLGLTVGPSLGGFLADHLGWRSIFYVNLPIGVVATALAFLVIPRSTSGRRREPFDLAGASALMIGLGALMLALSKGQDMTWTSPVIMSLFIGAVVFLAVFLWLERTMPHPMLDLSLFRDQLFSAATLSSFINYVCVYSIIFLMPFYLVQGRGFPAGFAGLLLTAQPIVMAVVAPISGYLSDRVGSRLPSTIGMALLAAGLFSLRDLNAQTSARDIILRLVLIGLGVGIFVTPNNSAILGSAPRQRQGIASGVVATARNLGMVFGVAAAGAIFSVQVAQRTTAHIPPQLAFFGAIQDTFLVITAIAVAGILLSAVRGGQGIASRD